MNAAAPRARTSKPTADRAATSAAAVAATGALACSVCCVLPFALPAAVLAGTGGVVAFFAGAAQWVTLVAVAIVAAAWARIASQSAKSRRRPARSTVAVVSAATLIAAVALAWPDLEPLLISLLRS